MECEMRFCEYEKMGDSLSRYDHCKEFSTTPWIVTEKIHGANFSFHTNGFVVQCARRRDVLKEGESFFNYNEAEFMSTTPDKIKDLFTAIREHYGSEDICQVSVYGELFGGLYNHSDVIEQNRAKPVQSEVQYSPTMQWWAFDITYRRTEDPEHHVYVDPEVALELFQRLDISHAKPLFTGPVNEAVFYPLGFDSTIPAALGLPPLPKGSNKAEGIVVKPIRNIYAADKFGDKERVILKIKLPEFMESANTPQKPEQRGKNANKNNSKASNQKANNQASILSAVMPLATHQRLISAVSKVGLPTTEQVAEDILTEFTEDTLNDSFELNGDNGVAWQRMSGEEQQKVRKIIRNKGHQLLKKHYPDAQDR